MQNQKELDIDFIGGLPPITPEEEKSLSIFFMQKKVAKKKSNHTKKLTKKIGTVA